MVGLVTKYAGGVVKGFALIAGTKARETSFFLVTIINHLVVPIFTAPLFYSILGLIITGLAQWIIDDKALAAKDWYDIFTTQIILHLMKYLFLIIHFQSLSLGSR